MILRQITTKVAMHQHSHLVSMSNMLDRGLNGTQQAQGPKTPQPIRSERTEWVQTWYALGTLIYGLGYYGDVRMMYRVSTEWVRTEGGWDDNIGLNRCRIDF